MCAFDANSESCIIAPSEINQFEFDVYFLKYALFINTFNYFCWDWINISGTVSCGFIKRFKLLDYTVFYNKIIIQTRIFISMRVFNLNRTSIWRSDFFMATKSVCRPRATICRISVENEIPILTDFTWLNRSEVNDISKMIEDLLHKRSMKYVVMCFNEKSKYLTSVGFPGIA